MLTWSYGGGTQSIAIAVLIAQGRLPKPDLIVMADTGREKSETWRYKALHVDPLLASIGLSIEIAPHTLAAVDIYDRRGKTLLPLFTVTGKLPTYCSVEWKRRVVRRYLRARGVRRCVTWLGISADEIGRLKDSDVQWQRLHYPLALDLWMTREQCRQAVLDFGLPEPPRSCCWMCPFMSNAEWRHMREVDPGDWDRAVALDMGIRARDDRAGLYLHRARAPLADVDLSEPDRQDGGLWDCESGQCWV